MSYTIKHYNGTLLTTVADGTVDTSTDLTLIGKNYAGYGQSQNDNFVWLLENFANTTQPPNPLAGQVWFDSANLKLKFYLINTKEKPLCFQRGFLINFSLVLD